MNVEEKASKSLCDCIKNNSIAQKYLCMNHWLSGSSTIVYPITIWNTSNQVELQWKEKCPKREAERFIKQILKQNCWLDKGYFYRGDGSCPDRIVFYW